jgi:DNA-binding NtrC family response regulator
MSEEAGRILLGHRWPGNVRELRNVIREAVLLATDYRIEADDVRRLLEGAPPPSGGGPANGDSVEAALAPLGAPAAPEGFDGRSLKEISDAAAETAERAAIETILKRTRGNKAEAARLLRVDYKTLHTKAKRFGF